MADLSKIINDPSVALLGVPRAPISSDPFTAGQRFAFTNDREREARAFMETLAGNNQLRQALQQRIMAAERQNKIIENLEQVRLTSGAPETARLAGFRPTNFASNQALIAQEGQRADVQLTASQAAQAGGEAGLLPRQSPEQLNILGTEVNRIIPTGVQEQVAKGLLPKVTHNIRRGPAAGGVLMRSPSDQEMLDSGGNIPSGPIGGVGQPTEAQRLKFEDITKKLIGGGNEYKGVIRPDGIMEIVEIEPGGAEEVVFMLDLDGKVVRQ